MQHDLRRQVFAAVQRLDGERQDALRTGQVVSRAITDLQLVQALLSMVPLALGYVRARRGVARGDAVAVAAAHARGARRAAGRGCGSRCAAARALFPATWSAQQRAADIAQQVEETVTGVRVVKGFGQEAREVATLEARRAAALRRAAARGPADRPAQPRRCAALPTLGQVAVIGVGGWLALNGSITLGTFLAFTTYVAGLVGPARHDRRRWS